MYNSFLVARLWDQSNDSFFRQLFSVRVMVFAIASNTVITIIVED